MEVFQQMAAVAVVLLLLGASLWVLRRRGFAGVTLSVAEPLVTLPAVLLTTTRNVVPESVTATTGVV